MDKRKNGKKKAKLNHSILVFIPKIYLVYTRCIQNLKNLALIGAEISVPDIFIEENEKCTNKGNDKQEEADSLLHILRSHTQHL